MLKDGIIRTSASQWNASLLIVPKKIDASKKPKLRVIVDFRRLNNLTIGDSFPLPNITDILDQLGNAKYFITLDLASGYHQIPMAERDKNKTAFSIPYGHYEFNRMPFGLKNTPATFQRLMNSVLKGIQELRCLVYLDDIVIYGSSLEDHNKRLAEVLRRLRENNLKLQSDKCEFLRKENNKQQIAFDTLKEKLMTAPVLNYPDFNEEFKVTTVYAIGAVLSQEPVGNDRPIAYARTALSRAEKNYNTTEKELLAIVWAVKHFRSYVL
ncbi:enzymatic polyprotein endonuclease reverse [Lasius niger]|uniref:Enzymatic polyprotein endonuclease reverse n=1 Tax=Lasius niger TaxID=67767 RepID=A0A0J7K622_LASNI|nr:enzymatic polyprotein endonuclease reverse [Lasius niger]